MVTSCKFLRDLTINAVVLIPTIQQIMELQHERKISMKTLLFFLALNYPQSTALDMHQADLPPFPNCENHEMLKHKHFTFTFSKTVKMCLYLK